MRRFLITLTLANGTTDTAEASEAEVWSKADAMVAAAGGGIPRVTPIVDAPAANDAAPRAKVLTPPPAAPAVAVATPIPAAPAKPMSTWTAQVIDADAKARIDASHAALQAAGIDVATAKVEQAYANGTRMADIGYATQQKRADDYAKLETVDACLTRGVATIEAEKRQNVEVSARDFARHLTVNGKLAVYGRRLSEQAIRGLMTRLEAPALSYVLGLRDRIAANAATLVRMTDDSAKAAVLADMRADKCKVAEILQHECERRADVALMLRMRESDVFAILSPGYSTLDLTDVAPQLHAALPAGARARFNYDAPSTAWEFQVENMTATPVMEQAVGEPFRGYGSFQSRDNGTGSFDGGGGVEILRCLNATTYFADGKRSRRVHRGHALPDVRAIVKGTAACMEAICKAMGVNRAMELDAPTGVKISDVIPGFWRALLTDRRSELAGVLPGRTEEHVRGLTHAWHGERRVADKLVRSDLAQGWTRYIQDQPTPVRRDAERAIGDWLVSPRPVGFVAAEK